MISIISTFEKVRLDDVPLPVYTCPFIGEGGSKDGIKDDVSQLLLPEYLAMSGQPSIVAIGIQ